MESIYIKPDEMTPGINLDKERNIFHFYGRSLPANAHKFYKNVLEWVIEYSKNPNPNTTITFDFEYFNSSSSNKISQILFHFEKIREKGFPVYVEWYYRDNDEDMKDVGELMSELVDIPFSFHMILS